MSHEPGRERHMTYACEHCRTVGSKSLHWIKDEDEYWCESCIDNANEAAYDRQQQDLMDGGGPPSLADQQAAARKLK